VLAAQVRRTPGGDLDVHRLISELDLSAARILQLRKVPVAPQQGVLWLEQDRAAADWGQLSRGLVVLVADEIQVRMQLHPVIQGEFGQHPSAGPLVAHNAACLAQTTVHTWLQIMIAQCINQVLLQLIPWLLTYH
jgi:hypothetical protein